MIGMIKKFMQETFEFWCKVFSNDYSYILSLK